MQKLIEYSEEDWVIKTILIFCSDIASKTRAAMPTMPFIPGPLTVTMVMLCKLEMAVAKFCVWCDWWLMSVPSQSKLNVLRMVQGILACINGVMVFGCKTLAPK